MSVAVYRLAVVALFVAWLPVVYVALGRYDRRRSR